MLNDTESYFNNGIKQAVAKGDIDKALKLMNEAERLGSKSARSTFIGAVKGKGYVLPAARMFRRSLSVCPHGRTFFGI